jgi:hypothetical protein
MPTKSKKDRGPSANDFDDIIADAQELNASVTTTTTIIEAAIITTTASSSSSSCSGSGSRSSSNPAKPTDEEVDDMLTEMCLAGDLAQMRRYLSR